MSELVCVYHDRAIVGEGVFWSRTEKKVYWMDLEGERACCFDPRTSENVSVEVGQKIGTIVEVEGGGFVVALKDGIYGLDFSTGKLDKWCDPMEGDEQNRSNDGKAGPDGRLYVGGAGPRGGQSLYRIERDRTSYEVIETGVTCSNGLVWSLDNKTMYYIDSPARVVWAYDFNLDTGSISNRRVVVDVTSEACVPDGMTIDAQGMVWVAFWEGGCVRRYNPNTGDELQRIELPVSRVTSCAFGGEALEKLYITTASVGFEDADWEREPLAGGLFVCKPGVKGVPSFAFRKE